MKAVSIPAPNAVEFIDIPTPQLGPETVLVEVRYVGLCGTDLNIYRGSMQLASYPRVPGHEVSGIIVEKGDQVPESIRLGQAVMASPYTACGLCPACRRGRPNCCQFNQTLGVQRDGVLTRYFAIHYNQLYTSATLSLQELALVEPLSVGYHAANRGRVTELDTVLVIGCGTIGIGIIAAAARKGATVIAADIEETKLAEARKFGAEFAINSAQENVLARVSDLTGQEGVSVAIEAVGLPETFRLAVETTAYAGRVVYVGYAKAQVCYDTADFVRKELDILGSRNALRVFPAVIKMLEKRQQPFEALITKVYPFTKAADAFHDWAAAPAKFSKILIDLQPKKS
jgi:threonine dehydrogenase-like Zn-dependent dehydrogenase